MTCFHHSEFKNHFRRWSGILNHCELAQATAHSPKWFSITWNLGTRHLFSYLWLQLHTSCQLPSLIGILTGELFMSKIIQNFGHVLVCFNKQNHHLNFNSTYCEWWRNQRSCCTPTKLHADPNPIQMRKKSQFKRSKSHYRHI